MKPFAAVLLTLRFLLELALLAAWAVVGWNLADPTWLQVTLAVLLPLASATVWGLYLSPKARLSLPLSVRVVMELALFAAASAGLWVVGFPALGIALFIAEALVLGGLMAVGQRPGQDASRTGLFE